MSGPVSSICQYHKTGFSKYREKCQNNHIDEICKNSECTGTCKKNKNILKNANSITVKIIADLRKLVPTDT